MFRKALITTTALFSLITLFVAGTASSDADAARRRRGVSKYQWVVKGKVNINRGNISKLRCLPGIGASKARAIVARRVNKPFTSLSQLRAIKGIGAKLYSRILPYVSLSGETTISKTRVRRGTAQ